MFRPRLANGSVSLSVVVAAMLLSACGSGGDTTVVKTVTNPPTTAPVDGTDTINKTPPATTSVPPATVQTSPPAPTRLPVVRLETFQTPSRNIGCVLLGGQARCDIRNRDWSPPPQPASCPLDWGQGVFVGGSGPGQVVCAGDTTLDPAAPTLAYRTIGRFGAFDCTSRFVGITCRNRRTGHGFFLARDRYRLY